MDQFTIYCTQEQTKKALELGAPIEDIPMFLYGENSTPKYVHKNEWNRECFCYCPTAEQMIGWLEEQGFVIEIILSDEEIPWTFVINKDTDVYVYDTREKATLAAIDSALDLLTVKKQLQ